VELIRVVGVAHVEMPPAVELVAHQPHDECGVARGTDLLAKPHLGALDLVRVGVRV